MNWKFAKSLTVALLAGVALQAANSFVTSTPALSAAAVKVENKALAEAINGAQADAKAGRYADAVTKAKAADAIQGKGPQLTMQVHQMIVAYSIQAKDYTGALAELDKMIAANEGDKSKNLSDALGLSLQMNNQQRAQGYLAALGDNVKPETRLFIAQAYVKGKKYKEALDMIQPLRANPTEPLLLFLQATYNEMNDAGNRRLVLEQLVADYPKPQYWHDLLQLARNERGLTDEQTLDILRLRLAVGDLKTDGDYQDMAQQALVTGYPNEAKSLLDKGTAAKILSGERADRLMKMTNDRVKSDTTALTGLQQKAATDPNTSVKLGLVYWTYGKNKEAEDAIRGGMKGKLADPEGAKVALGHVLLSSGKKADAVAAFNSVTPRSKEAGIARLWSIFARQSGENGEAKAAPAAPARKGGGKRA